MTFGCRVNQADSLAIEGGLRARGAISVSPADADVVVVNTCSVTAAADQGARQVIRRVARSNPDARIIVTGCYATRAQDDLLALPGVVRVVRNDAKDAVAELAAAETTTADRDGGGPCGVPLHPGDAGRTTFTLRVQTGCDQQCSYCIIPSTRGAARSRPIDEVAREVTQVMDAGYREICLTGVHLGSYGRDLSPQASLVTLLRRIPKRRDVLYRISSLEPMDCTPDIVSLVAAGEAFAPHLHLPLQHGSDEMLRAMRRPYTVAYYAELIERIARAMPHAAIGSDVIVGFPGETEAHVDDMVRVLTSLPLSHLHVFPYSDRPGTDACGMRPKVAGAAIRERARRIREVGAELARRFRAVQVGTVRRALVVDDGLSAVTDNYLKIRLTQQSARNTWCTAIVA